MSSCDECGKPATSATRPVVHIVTRMGPIRRRKSWLRRLLSGAEYDVAPGGWRVVQDEYLSKEREGRW